MSSTTYAVDTDRFAPGDRAAARAALGLPTDAFVIGMVGRFGPLKGHSLLIEAFELIAARFPGAHVLIAGGGGPCEEVIRTRAANSPQAARFHLIGFRDDPRACYHALDVLAIPSINEGMSNAGCPSWPTPDVVTNKSSRMVSKDASPISVMPPYSRTNSRPFSPRLLC